MRLIDADDVVTVFTNRLFEMLKTEIPCVTATESKICLETCYKTARFEVDNIPTAYDVDKVVEKLEEARSSVPVNRLLDDIIKDKPKELGMLIAYDDAIEIVKAGVN